MSDKQKKITQSEEEYFKNIVREELMNEQFAGGFSGLKKALGFGDRAKDVVGKEETGTKGVGSGYMKGKEEDVEATLDADATYVLSKSKKLIQPLAQSVESLSAKLVELDKFIRKVDSARDDSEWENIEYQKKVDSIVGFAKKLEMAIESLNSKINQVSKDVIVKDKENTDAINRLRAEIERTKGKKIPSKGESAPASRPAPKGRSGI